MALRYQAVRRVYALLHEALEPGLLSFVARAVGAEQRGQFAVAACGFCVARVQRDQTMIVASTQEAREHIPARIECVQQHYTAHRRRALGIGQDRRRSFVARAVCQQGDPVELRVRVAVLCQLRAQVAQERIEAARLCKTRRAGVSGQERELRHDQECVGMRLLVDARETVTVLGGCARQIRRARRSARGDARRGLGGDQRTDTRGESVQEDQDLERGAALKMAGHVHHDVGGVVRSMGRRG